MQLLMPRTTRRPPPEVTCSVVLRHHLKLLLWAVLVRVQGSSEWEGQAEQHQLRHQQHHQILSEVWAEDWEEVWEEDWEEVWEGRWVAELVEWEGELQDQVATPRVVREVCSETWVPNHNESRPQTCLAEWQAWEAGPKLQPQTYLETWEELLLSNSR